MKHDWLLNHEGDYDRNASVSEILIGNPQFG
jgi:hypothetical protein